MKAEPTIIGAVVAAAATVLAALINSANVPKLVKWCASLMALAIVAGAVTFVALIFVRPDVICGLGVDLGDTCPPPPPPSGPITGTYFMDHNPGRVITISHIGGPTYQVGEATSPWPWSGTANINGNVLTCECRFVPAGDWMRVEGFIRGDGSIEVKYIYLSGPGGPPTGRVDPHVWYR